ncbi:type II toxin-antitoxin system VapC family toxin [Nostoc sp. UHCC 0870]|uniref:type II toxin-antitoxin system VapC family toxin n=1 Tax=Nostoc sp. UHCC 0870 TaxID=2914041 RepID=UPI001EDED87F|nr:type II toxin-antitoxin system VapC family toxin [Nostoc sp. UHCC 0870]UKO97670.1 type II toxin-antitoxin system VapC family toxin [Nostoc sp. UHCC 0870]
MICVDANFVVKLINNPSENSPYLALWDNWEQTQTTIIAPNLLCYEVTNVFHRMQLAKQLLKTEAQNALNLALNLPIQFYSDRQLHQEAGEVAQQFNLSATYDAHYLALAQRFQAYFYTGDKRLFNTVSSVFSWVHLVE